MNAPGPLLRHSSSTSSVVRSDGAPSWWLGPRGRALLSVLILLHLLAVIGEPLRMFSQGQQPGSPDAQLVRRGLAPYIDFAYLHHGYFFFAPNPGPAHLMDIKLIDADGSTRHLRLPNHRAQWPRLLYHRHFMLSEFLFQLYTPSPSDLGPEAQVPEELLRDRALFERVRSSMEKHLAVRYGAERAEIQLMEHRLPNDIEVFQRGMKLTDDELYLLLPDQPEAAESAEPLPQGQTITAEQAKAMEESKAGEKNDTDRSKVPVQPAESAQSKPVPQPEEVRP